MKSAFLRILDNIEIHQKDPKEYLVYLFQLLMVSRDKKEIELARPTDIPINKIMQFLNLHFNHKYSASGGARLPVLAVYSIYECLISEVDRFSDKSLSPLQEHTVADSRSGSVWDIEIKDSYGRPFEGVEIKHNIKITKQIVEDFQDKIVFQKSLL